MSNKLHSTPYNAADYLQTPEDIVEYLSASIEENNGELLKMALDDIFVAISRSTDLARKMGFAGEALARQEAGNSQFTDLFSIIRALDLEISVHPRQRAA